MEIREISGRKPARWNETAHHPLQTWEWGEFRKLTGVRVGRYGVFAKGKLKETVSITIHSLPRLPWTIGYYPKGGEITKEILEILRRTAKKNNCVYIKCEPKVEKPSNKKYWRPQGGLVRGRALFTPHNFVLEVTPSEERLLAQMKQKTRYNIRLAKRKGVKVEIDNSGGAFERYLELMRETTERQKFYAHTAEYHRKMWKILREAKMAELLVARYQGKIITAWVLLIHRDTLYYPYGASTREHRSLMANNLVMWEAIRLAKKKGLKYLDMWGALGSKPNKNDPWYGFHKFKAGYGGRHVTYVGSWDYPARPLLYYPLRAAEGMRWKWLRMRK